jgi:hypothetical protein
MIRIKLLDRTVWVPGPSFRAPEVTSSGVILDPGNPDDIIQVPPGDEFQIETVKEAVSLLERFDGEVIGDAPPEVMAAKAKHDQELAERAKNALPAAPISEFWHGPTEVNEPGIARARG